MKAITKTTVRTLLIGLGFTVVLAAPGWAQFEVAPDHYQSKNLDAVLQPRMALSIQNKESAVPATLHRGDERRTELRPVAFGENSRAVRQQDLAQLRKSGLAATLRRAVRHLGQRLLSSAVVVSEADLIVGP